MAVMLKKTVSAIGGIMLPSSIAVFMQRDSHWFSAHNGASYAVYGATVLVCVWAAALWLTDSSKGTGGVSTASISAPINVSPAINIAPVFNNTPIFNHTPNPGVLQPVRSKRDEWLTLSKEFDALPDEIRVGWTYDTTGGKGIQNWGTISNHRCAELCTQGGLMMLREPQLLAEMCKKTPEEREPTRLWLQCLHERKGVEVNSNYWRFPNEDGSHTTSLQGAIPYLAQKSANLCRSCANWELMQDA